MKRSSPSNQQKISMQQQQQQQQPRTSTSNNSNSSNQTTSGVAKKRSWIDESDTTTVMNDVAASSSSVASSSSNYNRQSNNNRSMATRRSNTFSHVSNSNRNTDTKFSRVSQSMWDNFSANVQSFECFNKKLQLKEAIHEMLREIIPHIGVYIVGSSANGFGMNHSDVDLCLMMTENEIDQKFEAIQILKIFSRALKRAAFVRKIEVIHAKVPIIKFHDSHNGLDCDINLNNHIGIRNTHLLKSYSEQDWRVRPLVLTVKRWAKYHSINDASQSTISSYSLALMTIFYLQTIVKPAVLPVLQDLYPDKFDKNIPVNELRLNEKLASYTSENTMSLGELFLGFLDYYSKFNFQMNVISVRKGEIYPRSSLPREDFSSRYSQWKFILIEEPFDLSNTARSVHDEYVFEKIRDVFIRSKRRLEETRNLHSLFKERFYDDEKFCEYDYR